MIKTFINNLLVDIRSDRNNLTIVTITLQVAKKSPAFKDLSFKNMAMKFIIIPKPVDERKFVIRNFFESGLLII